MSVEDDARLADFLDQWESGYENGSDVSATELAVDCPELVPELEKRIKALRATAWLNEPNQLEDHRQSPEEYGLPATLGRYELQSLIGSGGFGQVWKAFDSELHRSVAIKVPHPDRIKSDRDAGKFLEEARRVAQLSHPGIVPVHDVGRDGDVVFIVSEFIDGKSLRETLSDGPLPENKSVFIVRSVALALDHAHSRGFVHRDVKPANIILDKDGKPKLADFGISVSSDDEDHLPIGTLAYMSPEQLRGGSTDIKSDIYSLGVVLFQMLTGHLPRQASSIQELRKSFESSTEVSFPNLVPSKFKPAVLKCLSVDPENRFQSADELASSLEQSKSSGLFGVSIASVLVLVAALTGYSNWSQQESTTVQSRNPLPKVTGPKTQLRETRSIAETPAAIATIKSNRKAQHVGSSPLPKAFEAHAERENKLLRQERLDRAGMTLLAKHTLPVVDVAVLPDKRTVASTDGESILISSMDGSQRSKTEFGAPVTALASVGKQLLASGTKTGLIHLWNVESAKPNRMATVAALSDAVSHLAGNPDFIVASSASGGIVFSLLDADKPTSVQLDKAVGKVLSINLISENEFAICMGANDDSLAVYRSYRFDRSVGEIHPTSNTKLPQMDHATSMAVSDDGQFVLVACHKRIITWKMDEHRKEMRAECLKWHSSDASAIAILDDQRSVVSCSGSDELSISYWDRLIKRDLAQVWLDAKVTSIAPTSPIVFGTNRGEVWKWEPSNAVIRTKRLFDGETLSGWSTESNDRPLSSLISNIGGGILRLEYDPSKRQQDHVIWSDETHQDFVLRLHWRVRDPSLRGKGSAVVLSNDRRPGLIIGIAGDHATGSFIVPNHFSLTTPNARTDPNDPQSRYAEDSPEEPMGEWKFNELEVVSIGNSITVISNGKTVNHGTTDGNNRFRIGLVSGGSGMQFRHIEVISAVE